MMGRTLAAIAFSVFSQSAIQLLVRGFYALHDTTTPFAISLFSVAANILLSIVSIFVLKLGIFGLALAFSISNFLCFVLLLLSFVFRKESFVTRNDLYSWLKMIFASILAAFGSWGSMRFLDAFVFETSRVIPLFFLTIISGLVGLLIYFSLSLVFKLNELAVVIKLFRKVISWRGYLIPEKIVEPYSEAGTGV